MRKTIIAVSILALSSCTSDSDFDKGRSQLEQMGYTDVKNTGYSLFCCSEKDQFSTGFSAKNKKGETVEGCFCSSIVKGITIRFK